MAASYPSALPTKSAAGANLATNPHSALHDDLAEEVVAVATELGTNPKGTSASVKARLDTIQTKVNGMVAGRTTATTTAAGELTVNFGVTFASVPRVITTAESTLARIAIPKTGTGTTTSHVITYRNVADGTVLGSQSVTVDWLAIGTLA